MRRTLMVLALAVAAGALCPAAQTSPKLVVILVVDQLRADYLTHYDRHWRAGFRTLLSEGAVFENANYPYLMTVTCAGHATIGTGAFPRTHGMITNNWWRRDTGTGPECTADSTVPAVSYGAAVQVGSSPRQLLVPTLADEMRAKAPGTRVVAISLKSRGAIPLAGQAADAVVWFDDPAGTFTTSRTYAQAPVPAVKRFIDANPFERDYGRTWTLLAPRESYLQRDAGVGERPPTGWTALFPHTIPVPAPAGRGRGEARAGGGGTAAAAAAPAAIAAASPAAAARGATSAAAAARGATSAAAAAPAAAGAQTATTPAATAAVPAGNPSALWQSTPFADAYLERMALSLVDSFELGRRTTTDFLGISFSTLDDVGHAFGPESREVEDTLRHLDVTLGDLIQALDTRLGRANYVLGLSADHGVAPYTGMGPRGGRVHTEDVRDRIDEVLTDALGPPPRGSYVDSMLGSHVYFAAGVFDRLKMNTAAMAAVVSAVEEMPGVARLLRTDQLSDKSSDRAVRAAALSYVAGRSGDLAIVVEPYWVLQPRATQTAGHGTIHEYDTHVPLIFLGGAFKPGRSKAAVTPADLAPTLARTIGVVLPKAEGRALTSAIR